MIATGNDIDACGEYLLGRLNGNAGTTGGVFTVGDDEIQGVLLTEFGKQFLDCAPPWLANDVADEKQFHAGRLVVRKAMCNGQ